MRSEHSSHSAIFLKVYDLRAILFVACYSRHIVPKVRSFY